jgi:hydroxymethylpyrimidine kinase/phosphomethylpyrimidine kinase/thiamine-phosphate diphosphorylase
MGAYGVHLGQSDLDPCDLRQLAAANLRLGISTHSYDEAARAHALRPSYIALGPIFETTSKDMPFAPQGMARIAEWQRLWSYPLVAIGGLTVAHAAEAMRRGANGVACISDVTKAADPERQIRRWLNAVTPGIDPVVPSQR